VAGTAGAEAEEDTEGDTEEAEEDPTPLTEAKDITVIAEVGDYGWEGVVILIIITAIITILITTAILIITIPTVRR
jgi:hypothetical protein